MGTSFSLSIYHSDTVRHFILSERQTTVGRDPFSDIYLGDPVISRHQLTLQPAGDAVLVTMNGKSRNVMVRNGEARISDEVHSGECFHIGAFRFEITVTTALPKAHTRGLNPDPAGPIDLSVLDDSAHIAPRWRSNAPPSLKPIEIADLARKEGADPEAQSGASGERPSFSPAMRIGLLGMLCLVGGYLLYDFTRPPPPPRLGAGNFAGTDLMAAVKAMGCDSEVECLERARDSYRVASELSRSSSHDLITLYKITRLLHRARRALGPGQKQLPELDPLYVRVHEELKVVFADTAFLYQRALDEEQLKEQKSIVLMLMHLCSEDRHVFCVKLETAFLSFPDGSP
jgi:pSer/pThr/pTyr-binding forkhead associated (FHA) protein